MAAQLQTITTRCPRRGDIVLVGNIEWEVIRTFPLIDRETDRDGYEVMITRDDETSVLRMWDDDDVEWSVVR